jgi:gentisate 1,2-dioxygenase
MGAFRTQETVDDRQREVIEDATSHRFVPGWHRPGRPPVWERPLTDFVTAHWGYDDAHRILEHAGTLDLENAERRNLILANPFDGNTYPTNRTIVAAYQMLLPAERARTHRHTPHAGRLIFEADDVVATVVDGADIPMRPGDVLLTPSWSWHGHEHRGNHAAYWLDFLDVPLVQLLEPMFFEPHPDGFQPADSAGENSPFRFAWETTQERLAATPANADGAYGRRIELGSPALPTIGLFMHQIDADQTVNPPRSSAHYQFAVVQGAGTSQLGEEQISWQRGDVFTYPVWTSVSHQANEDSVLFEMTDEPLQRYCGYLREQPAQI